MSQLEIIGCVALGALAMLFIGIYFSRRRVIDPAVEISTDTINGVISLHEGKFFPIVPQHWREKEATDGDIRVLPARKLYNTTVVSWDDTITSRFIHEGAWRVESHCSVESMMHNAFTNSDGTKVLVLSNEGPARKLSIEHSARRSLIADLLVPAGALLTLVWK